MDNTFGQAFRVTTYGESHGGAVGCVIDGCPPGLRLDLEAVQAFADRRRPGVNPLGSARAEPDRVVILSGVEAGVTLGTPIHMQVTNQDARPEDYAALRHVYRPSHADFTTEAKFGLRAGSGGGRASVRETVGRVMAAAVAEQVLAQVAPGLEVVAFVDSVQGLRAEGVDLGAVTRAEVDRHFTRCPDGDVQGAIVALITQMRDQGDSVGGTIVGVVRGCPAGLGGPVFDKLTADLAKGMMSLPASRGFEIGEGFGACVMKGSEHNDAFIRRRDGRVGTETNRSGGIQGGISNGEMIWFRVGFKPVATIFCPQRTVDSSSLEEKVVSVQRGRHDPCVLPRAVPLVEAMTLLVLADHWLRQRMVRVSSEASRET